MKKLSSALTVSLFLMPLSACSGKPDASDVEKGIKEFWSPCKLVKVTNVKKTNGLDRGNSYQMAISYQLELVRDVAKEDIWKPGPREGAGAEYARIARSGNAEDLKKWEELQEPGRLAAERVEKFINEACPMPVQRVFYAVAVADRKSDLPLRQGEYIDVATEFSMIKTEQGWMAR